MKKYVHGPGVDEPVITYPAGGGRQYFHTDERGSIIAETNDSGGFCRKLGIGIVFALTGKKKFSTLNLPYGMDDSAKNNVGAGMATEGCSK